MPYISQNGSKTVIVPTGQYIIVGTFGPGAAIISASTGPNGPPLHTNYQIGRIENTAATYGPWLFDMPITILAAPCMLEYVIGATPALTFNPITPVFNALKVDTIAVGGATIGSDAVAITGDMAVSGTVALDGNLSLGTDSSKLYLGHLNDLIISWNAAAAWQFGAEDAAAPVAQIMRYQSVVAGTTNTAGKDATIELSAGTGTGIGGKLVIKGAPHGSTGSAQNALATVLTIDGDTKVATFAGAVEIGNVANAVSPTSPDRTITIKVGGVTLYLAAKTTND